MKKYIVVGWVMVLSLWPFLYEYHEINDVSAEEKIRLNYAFSINSRNIPGGLKDPQGIYWDQDGQELYVANTGNHTINVLDKQGLLLYTFGPQCKLSSPLDIVVKERRLYISDLDYNFIKIVNYRGELLSRLKPKPEDVPDFLPGRMALGPDGYLYVVNRATQNVVVFDSHDRFLKNLFSKVRFNFITGIIISPQRELILVDAKGPVVNIFNHNGEMLSQFGTHGIKSSDFTMPGQPCIDLSGMIWIIDTFSHSLKIFTRDGGFISSVGGMGKKPGEFFYPVDIDLRPPGYLYVLDKGNARIQVFDISGIITR